MKATITQEFGALSTRVKAVEKYVHKNVAPILHNACNIVAQEAQRRAPYETGDLKDSTFVMTDSVGGRQAKMLVGLGGPSAPYALTQHEMYPNKKISGEMKYLENAVIATKASFLQYIAMAFKRGLEQMMRKKSVGKQVRPEYRFKKGPE